MKTISRRKSTHVQGQQQPTQVQNTSTGSCVEVGKFGLDEEVERLKRDKNVLMQELVRLRQQQQATDQQLHTVGQRVHLMEQRQQQMMSFLAKAMQSPGFMAQLVHPQNDSNRRISGINKKRRLPNQDEENLAGNHGATLPDGQIVKFQPQMNEAAKAVFRQILKINASSRLEQKINHANGYLIDGAHTSANALESSSASSRISGVTLSEVLPSVQPHVASDPVLKFDQPSSVVSTGQSSPSIKSGEAKVSNIPLEVNILSPQEKLISMDLYKGNGIIPEISSDLPNIGLKGSEGGETGYVHTIPEFVDGGLPVMPDGFSSDPDGDILLDEIPKLPSINDSFWEQFLSQGSLSGEVADESSSSLEENVSVEQNLQMGTNSEWDRLNHMNNLTEQMGLLVSGSKPG